MRLRDESAPGRAQGRFDAAPASWRRDKNFEAARCAADVAAQGPSIFETKHKGANRSKTAYAGPMALLVDGECASACEDLAIRFQSGRRGLLLGEPTFGSTGQPIQVSFPELGMSLRVSTKRESFADGSHSEGVGVRKAC